METPLKQHLDLYETLKFLIENKTRQNPGNTSDYSLQITVSIFCTDQNAKEILTGYLLVGKKYME